MKFVIDELKLRMPKHMKAELKAAAALEYMSLNGYVVQLLKKHLENKKPAPSK